MSTISNMIFVLLLLCFVSSSRPANILAIFPHPGKTHVDVFKPLVLQLASRGHSLTVLSFFPEKTPIANYTDISLVGEVPIFMNAIPLEYVKDLTPRSNFELTMDVGYNSCKRLMKTKQIQDLIKSENKYDLIIIELFNSDCFFSIVDVLKVPHIGISSCMTFPHHHHRIGNPDSFSFASNVMTPYSSHMTLSERLMNTVNTIAMQVFWIYYCRRRDQEIVDRDVGRGVSLERSTDDISLVLVNSHHSIHGSRPLVPGLIEVGGLNIVPSKPVDQVRNCAFKLPKNPSFGRIGSF